jgi:type IV secretion system protein VirD4
VRLSDYARKHGEGRKLPVEVNVILDEFCNIGKILDFKKTLSTVRSRGINCQIVVQSVAQLADRYPRTEWQELVGNCDTHLFLGCNDEMTAEFISKQCGEVTIRVNDATIPMQPLFFPAISSTRPYSHMKKSAGRPLMMPDEVRRLPKEESILLVRSEKPLKLKKIIPEEHPSFSKLTSVRVNDYLPEWRKNETKNPPKTTVSEDLLGDIQAEPEEFFLDDTETDLNLPIRRDILSSAVDCGVVEVQAEEV